MFNFSESSYNDIMLLIFCLLLASVVTKNSVGTPTVWQNMLQLDLLSVYKIHFTANEEAACSLNPRFWFFSVPLLSRCTTSRLAVQAVAEICLLRLVRMARWGCSISVTWNTAPSFTRTHSTTRCCVSAGISRIPTTLLRWPWTAWRWGGSSSVRPSGCDFFGDVA